MGKSQNKQPSIRPAKYNMWVGVFCVFMLIVADSVIFMDEGAIVEVGTPEHFFKNPTHERTKLFLSQIL